MVEFSCLYKQNSELNRSELQAKRLPQAGDFVGIGSNEIILRCDWRYIPTDGQKPVIYCSVACEENAALWREALTYDKT